jgi:hypothetical protein
LEFTIILPDIHLYSLPSGNNYEEIKPFRDKVKANVARLVADFDWPTHVDETAPPTVHKLLDISNIKNSCTPYERIEAPSTTDFKGPLKDSYFTLEMSGVKKISDYSGPEKEIKAVEDRYKMTFTPKLILVYPLEYALWSTLSTGHHNFVPLQFWKLVSSQILVYATSKRVTKASLPPIRMNNAYQVSLDRDTYIRENGVRPIKRSNPENLLIASDGSIIYAPEYDNVKNYADSLKQAWDPNTGYFKKIENIPQVKNQGMLTDWVSNKLYYTDHKGEVQAEDLSASMPLDDVTIMRMLDNPIGNMKERIGNALVDAQLVHLNDLNQLNLIGPETTWDELLDLLF